MSRAAALAVVLLAGCGQAPDTPAPAPETPAAAPRQPHPRPASAAAPEAPASSASALARRAIDDPSGDARVEAVRAIERDETPAAVDALAAVVEGGAPGDRAWQRAVAALVARAPDEAAGRVFPRTARARPATRVPLAQALRRTKPTEAVKRFLLEMLAGDDDLAARLAAETLFSFTDRAAETFAIAVDRVMPALEGHGTRLAFGRAAARTQTREGAAALARYAAASDDVDDWAVLIEVLGADVEPEHQDFFGEVRAVAVKVTDWRFQIEVRNLIRAIYAEELVLRVHDEPFVYEAILTREDVLDWEIVQRRARRGRAVVWVYPFGASHEIPVVTKPQDILVLDADRRVLETYAAINTRGVQSPDGVMYIVVLPEGAVERLSIAERDVIDLDAELVHALSEMELQDRPTGRGL